MIGSSIFGVVCLIERMYSNLLCAYGDVVMSSCVVAYTTIGYRIMSSQDSTIVMHLYGIVIKSCKICNVSSVTAAQ